MINIGNKCRTAFVQVIFEDADHEDLTPAVVKCGFVDRSGSTMEEESVFVERYVSE